MDWLLFWSVYPGTILAFTVFFARHNHHMNRYIERDRDKLSPGQCVTKGVVLALVWPLSVFFGSIMLSLSRADRRKADAEEAELRHRQDQVHANRLFEVAHRTVREHYIQQHADWAIKAANNLYYRRESPRYYRGINR